MSADLDTIPWDRLTRDEKRELRRRARARWAHREREWRASERPRRRRIVVPEPLEGLSARCEEGNHPWCARVLSCGCPCHRGES